MPPLAAVKQFLQNLRLSLGSLEHGSITRTMAGAPTIRDHDGFDGELLQAAHLQNQSLPVNQLPNELLVRIFMLVGPQVWKPTDNPSPAWVKLMLVCRYWRDIALATPGIWRSIEIGRNANWTDLTLIHSDPAPIEIHMRSYYASEEQMRLIYPHARRIRRLIFYNGLDMQWSSALHTLFDQPMPTLETLALSMAKPYRTSDSTQLAYPDMQLSSENFPRLQMLSLSHVVMPRDPLIFSKLDALTLKRCECDYSLDQFLDVLSSCFMLRKLCLLSFLNHLTGDWPLDPISQRAPISLPRIAVVVLGHHPPRHSWHFLELFLLPANTHLTVHVDGSIRGPHSNECLLDAIPHSRGTVLPVLCAADKAEFQVEEKGYCIRGATRRSGQKCSLELRYNPGLHSAWDSGPGRRELSPRGLADLASVLGQVSSLRCLSIRGLCGGVTQAKWRGVLDAFPRLTELRVNDDGPMVAFIGALQSDSPTGPSSTPEHDLDAGRQSLFPCPELEFLALEFECSMYIPFLDMLLDCLQCRIGKGVRLHQLELRSFSPADAIEEDWAAFVRELEGLVPEVSYGDQRDAKREAAIINPFLRDL